jgi:hypothetical protein
MATADTMGKGNLNNLHVIFTKVPEVLATLLLMINKLEQYTPYDAF